MQETITAELYNVADPIPDIHLARFNAFYTNPPFGASNGGKSIEAFLKRGDEALGENGIACVVMADDPNLPWTIEVMKQGQRFLSSNGYVFAELLPRFHRYHLDDNPELTSCSLIAVRHGGHGVKSVSAPLANEDLENFYGRYSPLTVRYVRDCRKGGTFPSRDHYFEKLH